MVVKGVNKNVIEICDTGNDFFEKAILFVRPGGQDSDSERLRNRADEFLTGLRLRPWCYPKNKWIFTAAKLLLSAGFGAGLACLFMLL